MKEGPNITAENPRNKSSMQSSRFGYCIGGLVARQARVSRLPAKHNRLSRILKVGRLNHDLSKDGVVSKATTVILQRV
jgi:hypothetical protein